MPEKKKSVSGNKRRTTPKTTRGACMCVCRAPPTTTTSRRRQSTRRTARQQIVDDLPHDATPEEVAIVENALARFKTNPRQRDMVHTTGQVMGLDGELPEYSYFDKQAPLKIKRSNYSPYEFSEHLRKNLDAANLDAMADFTGIPRAKERKKHIQDALEQVELERIAAERLKEAQAYGFV